MRGHMLGTTVALCAAALFTAALAPASAAPAASPRAAHAVQRQPSQPVIVDCVWQPHVRPGDFMIACGDGNSYLSKLHWSHWDQRTATATGVNVVNDCKPYCAAGKFHSYAVTVRLDRPQAWKKHPQLRHYARMSLTYSDARPEGFARVVTYPLWN